MQLLHFVLLTAIPFILASLPALAHFLAAIRINEQGHDITTLRPEHMYGWGALCLLIAAATAATFFFKGTTQHIKGFSSSFSPSPLSFNPMRVKLQPIERFLDVPDLVGSVFERLDPASRRAFFQTCRLVAHAGPVLVQCKMRIQLNPTSSQEDQWQRLLCLTRSQPPRCLVLSAPSKAYLLDFLRCIPEGKQEEKQRVLQGTELHLQVLIKLDTGGASQLQSHLSSWREEQQQEVEGAVVQLVLDLCGRELIATTEGDLEPPNCTLRNGTLLLPGTSCVKVAAKGVRFEGLTIKGVGEQECVVNLQENSSSSSSSSSLAMEGCRVEGGVFLWRWHGVDMANGAAVRVVGRSSLSAQQTTFHSSSGSGLLVRRGSRVVLENCTASDNGHKGLDMLGGALHAVSCRVDSNDMVNIDVECGADACLEHVSSNSGFHGWVVNAGSMTAKDSEASHCVSCSAYVDFGGSLTLERCKCDNSGIGLLVDSDSIVVAQGSSLKDNFDGNACNFDGRIILRDCELCELGGEVDK